VIGEPALRAILEAARWAPSYGNTQPARYVVGRRGDPTFQRIFDVLNRGNQAWAGAAAALLLACAETVNEKGQIPLAEYGVGLASENLVLQAVALGLVAHQMGGFDAEAARRSFDLPAHVRPLAAIAVGRQGSVDLLAEDRRAKERAPRRRKPLGEIAFRGTWGNPAF
jgi:nitroreductase